MTKSVTEGIIKPVIKFFLSLTRKMFSIIPSSDDIIKRKLLIDGDGLGDDRRINMAMKHFFRWFSSPNNDQDL